MTEPSTKEHLPTREELAREARRLARIRHLSVVPDPPERADEDRIAFWHEPDPDPPTSGTSYSHRSKAGART
jgi:hypothetical protein